MNHAVFADILPNMTVPKNRFDSAIKNFLALDPWKAPNALSRAGRFHSSPLAWQTSTTTVGA